MDKLYISFSHAFPISTLSLVRFYLWAYLEWYNIESGDAKKSEWKWDEHLVMQKRKPNPLTTCNMHNSLLLICAYAH